jgi:hypothetical protein
MKSSLINTPLQRGDQWTGGRRNRFNGFDEMWETVETVSRTPAPFNTPLKRGVNEKALRRSQRRCETFRPKEAM